MADKLSTLARSFTKAMNARGNKPSSYIATAEVTRIDNKTAWVKLPGSDIETPVTMAIAAKKGDIVKVSISNHVATITGNIAAPPTDDTKANSANEIATKARTLSENNVTDVGEAKTQAQNATKYANSALDQLGIVEDVVGVLNWASEHGTFVKTSDSSIVENKVYFIYDSVSGDYMPVVDPQESDLNRYYELSVDEAMQTYILSHLAVTRRGLWVLPAGIGSSQDEQYAPGYKMLLTSGDNPGMYFYDENGIIVAVYGSDGTTFSSDRIFHIGTQDAYILFTPASGSTGASISIGGANITLGDTRSLDDVLASMDSTISNTLIYDHTYTYTRNEVTNEITGAHFEAFVYRGGVDIKTTFPTTSFSWYLKDETETNKERSLGTGYYLDVSLDACGYGAEIIGKFTPPNDSELLDTNGSNLTNGDGDNYTVQATGDPVRVRDLAVSTVIFPTDKLMVVGGEDEHLVTIQTLAQYILESETHILYCGTATELV